MDSWLVLLPFFFTTLAGYVLGRYEGRRGSDMTIRVGCNLKKPIREVQHAKLKRLEGSDSIYKSDCPTCESGVLLVSRPPGIFALNRYERCTLCGQAFWYTDAGVGQEKFLTDQPRNLTPEIVARYAKAVEGLPDDLNDPSDPPTLWDRLQVDSER